MGWLRHLGWELVPGQEAQAHALVTKRTDRHGGGRVYVSSEGCVVSDVAVVALEQRFSIRGARSFKTLPAGLFSQGH